MTLELGPDDKRMRLRYAGTCRLCGQAIAAGVAAIYERGTKTVRCLDCMPITTAPEPGTAGGSARREYERRRDNREHRIRTDHPKLGGLILALSDAPQSTKAWESGAVGEELMALRLADLPDTFRVLHDRRIPGTRANIDHIAIGPSGVWVIDAKRYVASAPHCRSRVACSGLVSNRSVSGAEADRNWCAACSPRSSESRRLSPRNRHRCPLLSRSRLAPHRRLVRGRGCAGLVAPPARQADG